DFAAARLFRHDPASGGFHAAPDYPLPLESLVGVDRQKGRFLENLVRFAGGLPANHALLWGVRGTGKSSLAKAAFMAAGAAASGEEGSVSDRFGLWIGFPPMDQEVYLAAVKGYAKRYGLKTPDLERRALQWAQLRGARSGRVAWQFIRDLAGELGKPLPL